MLERRHIPNALTALRLFLCFVSFLLLSLFLSARASGGGGLGPPVYTATALGRFYAEHGRLLLNLVFAFTVVAAVTDILDGYLARRWNVTTAFGRIADPFADKILISGTFVFLASAGSEVVFIAPWMVVAILAREYLVTSMRGYAESRGIAFPASVWGKMKMVLQSVAAGMSTFHLANEGAFSSWYAALLRIVIWAAVGATLISGFVYIRTSGSILKGTGGDVESEGAALRSDPPAAE